MVPGPLPKCSNPYYLGFVRIQWWSDNGVWLSTIFVALSKWSNLCSLSSSSFTCEMEITGATQWLLESPSLACKSWFCAFLSNSEFSDVTLISWKWPGGSISTMEAGRSFFLESQLWNIFAGIKIIHVQGLHGVVRTVQAWALWINTIFHRC